jgi:hypothetical protein
MKGVKFSGVELSTAVEEIEPANLMCREDRKKRREE